MIAGYAHYYILHLVGAVSSYFQLPAAALYKAAFRAVAKYYLEFRREHYVEGIKGVFIFRYIYVGSVCRESTYHVSRAVDVFHDYRFRRLIGHVESHVPYLFVGHVVVRFRLGRVAVFVA